MADVAETTTYSSGVTAVVSGTPRSAASVNAGLAKLANRTKWIKDRLYDLLLGAPLTISAANTTTDRLTVTSHGIPANTAVQVFAANGGSLPGGLAISVVYYVNVIDADTIELSATSGPGASVNLSAGFSGDCYVQIIPDWLSTLLIADSTWGYGKLTSLVCFLAGSQAITGAKTVTDITWSGTTRPKVTARSIARALAVTWTDGSGNAYCSIEQPIVAAAGTLFAEFEVPDGQTLTSVSILINPDNVGVLPGTPPTFNGSALDITTSLPAGAGFGPIADPATPVASYNAIHEISSGVLSEATVATARIYTVSFTNNTADPIKVLGLRAVCSVTSISAWC